MIKDVATKIEGLHWSLCSFLPLSQLAQSKEGQWLEEAKSRERGKVRHRERASW